MHNKAIGIAVSIFVLIIAGMFVYSYIKRGELDVVTNEPVVPTPSAGPYDSIDRIDAKHFYIDGTHTLAGAIALPTPCELLDWDVTVAESFPEQVTVHFDVINEAETCAEVVTEGRFSVSFDASEGARIGATFNGRPVELNLFPPAPGETPGDFELFIKG